MGLLINGLIPADDAVAVFEDGVNGSSRLSNFNAASGFHFFAGAHEAFPLEL